ncbi:MAG TPA: TonB family protein [Opitutaceae bacterium]|nr:TonB family protein [Opitutaceae bacterium]
MSTRNSGWQPSPGARAIAAAILAGAAATAWPEEEVLRIRHAPKPDYPARAMAEGLGAGEVRMLLEVDEFGQVADSLVVAHTHQVFATALERKVQEWRFVPARRDGHPCRTIVTVDFDFRIGTEGMVFVDRKGPASNQARAGQPAGKRFVFEPCAAQELDRPLRPLERIAPAYPQALKQGGTGGRVLVEFHVDPEGHARFPRVVMAAHPVLDAAAVAAVKQWRFEPPRRKGRPAIAHVTQAFDFMPDAAP